MCIGKLHRRSQFTSAKSKSITVVKNSCTECAVSICAVDVLLWLVCRDNDVLFSAPQSGRLQHNALQSVRGGEWSNRPDKSSDMDLRNVRAKKKNTMGSVVV